MTVSEIKFLFIAVSEICLGIFEGFHGSHRAVPEPMCLPIMTQAGREHVTQCISLVYIDALRIMPQRQTFKCLKQAIINILSNQI